MHYTTNNHGNKNLFVYRLSQEQFNI